MVITNALTPSSMNLWSAKYDQLKSKALTFQWETTNESEKSNYNGAQKGTVLEFYSTDNVH